MMMYTPKHMLSNHLQNWSDLGNALLIFLILAQFLWLLHWELDIGTEKILLAHLAKFEMFQNKFYRI